MIPPRSLLVATDFSGGSSQAADTALDLAERWGCRVDWVHVSPELSQVFAPSADVLLTQFVEREQHEAHESLERLEDRARQRGIETASHLLHGPSDRSIESCAQEIDADWVVLGTHGRSGLQALLLGSVAERVVRTAARTTLTVRPGAPLVPGGTVLFGEDFGPSSPRAAALDLARALDCELVLVHAIDFTTGVASNTSFALPPALVDSARQQAHERLSKICAQLGEGVRSEVCVEPAPSALCDLARSTNASLVVTGASSRHGFERWILGSVAEKTLRHAPCSVLTLREGLETANEG